MESTGVRDEIDSRDALALSLVLFLILSIAFLMPIQPNDFWWYLRIAAETIQNRAIPQTEIISFTQAGLPGIYQHWLAGMLFLGASKLAGITGVSLLRGLSIGITYSLLYILVRRQGLGRLWAILLVLIASLAGSNNWAMRPQVLVYPLFIWVVLILDRWNHRPTRSIWWLPVITAFWVNLHSSFVSLFLLSGAALLFGRGNRRQLGISLVCAALATGLTPQGFQNWGLLAQISTNPSVQQFASEWKPPTNAGWQLNLFFLWLLLFPVLAGVSQKRLSIFQWVWFTGFGWLGLSSLRHVTWLLTLLAYFSAILLTGISLPTLGPRLRFQNHLLNKAFCFFLLVGTLLMLPGIRQRWWIQAPHSLSANTPVEAVHFLQQNSTPGKQIFAELAASSYLAYTLPDYPVWIYPRFEVFPPEQWQEYQQISQAGMDWDILLKEDGVDLILGNKQEQHDLYAALQQNPFWHLEYKDDTFFIYAAQAISD